MLISALCEYYDILAKSGKVLPDGYSAVGIDYLVALNADGSIASITDWHCEEQVKDKKGNIKIKSISRNVTLPKRTEKTCVDPNIVDHRPLYLFGLNFADGALNPQDKTNKAQKSHELFCASNLEFIEGLDSPVINAFREFMLNWNPDNETENMLLLGLGKAYGTAKFAFCLSGRPDLLLHEDSLIKQKWESRFAESNAPNADDIIAQCGICGEQAPIARLHNKISGMPEGMAMGNTLICMKNSSEESYGNTQSYNSNISVSVMNKYTTALNLLIKDRAHRSIIDDITVIYFAMSPEEQYDELAAALMYGDVSDTADAAQTDNMLRSLITDAASGNITPQRIGAIDKIDPNVDFYIIGLKPNTSRIALKFIYRRKFGEMLCNIAKHQADLQISEAIDPVPMWMIKKELISPNSTSEKVNPALMAKIFESVIYGTPYPTFLLGTVIRRVKTDRSVNKTRAGLIKACISRKQRLFNNKESC